MDRHGKRQQVGNQHLTTEKKQVPHSYYSMCQAKGDDNSARPYGTVQLLLHRRRKCLVLRSAQKGLLTCMFWRKEKQRNLGQLSEVALTQKTVTLISLPISQLQSVLDALHLLAVLAQLCLLQLYLKLYLLLPEGQQVNLLHPRPHQPLAANDPCLNEKAMLVLHVRMVAATWSHLWLQQGIFFPFFLIKQWQALYAVVRGQRLPELSQKSNIQKPEVLNTFNSDFVLSDCKHIYRRSNCILRVILQFFCKTTYNIFPRI